MTFTGQCLCFEKPRNERTIVTHRHKNRELDCHPYEKSHLEPELLGTRCMLNGINLEVHPRWRSSTVGGWGTGNGLLRLVGLAQPDRGHVLVNHRERRASPPLAAFPLNAEGMERLERLARAVVFREARAGARPSATILAIRHPPSGRMQPHDGAPPNSPRRKVDE